MTDTVADGFELVSAKRGWFGISCPVAYLRNTTCTIGTLGPDTFVVLTVRAAAAGTFTPTASIISDLDTDLGNNATSVDIVVAA